MSSSPHPWLPLVRTQRGKGVHHPGGAQGPSPQLPHPRQDPGRELRSPWSPSGPSRSHGHRPAPWNLGWQEAANPTHQLWGLRTGTSGGTTAASREAVTEATWGAGTVQSAQAGRTPLCSRGSLPPELQRLSPSWDVMLQGSGTRTPLLLPSEPQAPHLGLPGELAGISAETRHYLPPSACHPPGCKCVLTCL